MDEFINIDRTSATARYKQIVHAIISSINDGKLQAGDKIPSLNQLVNKFGISQDTVLAAYNELKYRGIVSSSIGKGYFIARTDLTDRHNVFVLFDKMTPYKEVMYNSMQTASGKKAGLDIYFHHGNKKTFETLIKNALGNYTAYVIVPIISPDTDIILDQIPKKKLYIIDQGMRRYGKKYRSVCQNFEKDIYTALSEAIDRIRKYQTIYFISRDNRPQFKELERGFVRFCKDFGMSYAMLDHALSSELAIGDLYILPEDGDLVHIVKKCREKGFTPGKEVGIISYNDTPFKEIIADGISCISTDFNLLGQSIIEMILENKTRHIENPSKLIMRNSL